MPPPKDPTEYKIYIEKLRQSHLGKAPGNKGKPSPFKGLTYEEIGREPSPLINVPRPDWVREKISAGHLKGNLPSEERDGTKTDKWRRAVKKRDNYTCQGCGVKQKDLPRKINDVTTWLHAHHIKSWREFPLLRFDITNGITYCWSCHLKAENKQITVPDSMPLPVKKQRVYEKGRTLEQIYGEERATEIRQNLSTSHLGQQSWSKGKTFTDEHRKKLSEARMGKAPHNKGKTNVEIYGEEKATELSKIAADNAKRTKNRLGTGTSEEARKNIAKGQLGKTSHRKGISNLEEYGEEKAKEIHDKKSEAAKLYHQEKKDPAA